MSPAVLLRRGVVYCIIVGAWGAAFGLLGVVTGGGYSPLYWFLVTCGGITSAGWLGRWAWRITAPRETQRP